MSATITYRSVAGAAQLPYIDCDRCIRALYARIRHYLDQDAGDCPLCRYFRDRLGGRDGSEDDARLLLHAQINVIYELFSRHADADALQLLARVEDDCC